jgi:hypothetical protein
MQQPQDRNGIHVRAVRDKERRMRDYKFPCAADATRSAKLRILGQSLGLSQDVVQLARRGERRVGGDVLDRLLAVDARAGRPNDTHGQRWAARALAAASSRSRWRRLSSTITA